jgi:hypothetical protein
LDFGISDAADVAAGIEGALSLLQATLDFETAANLWRLAARAYRLAKNNQEANRCQVEVAECLVKQSEKVLTAQGSAFLASHSLSAAIAELHGVPGKKDLRTKLRHRLVDVQSQIPEEMSVFSQETDISDIVRKVEKGVEKLSLLDQLFMLSEFARSPEPAKLVEDATRAIQEHPLASLFGAAHMDSEGKVVHRTEGGVVVGGGNDPAIRQQIAQAETIRRNVAVSTGIEVVRRVLNEQYYLSEDDTISLFRHSGFVPDDLVATFARGALRFIRGDFVSAIYILTPLLENSLRYVLKAHGYDVTIFDDTTQTQQDRTISSLIEQMRSELESIFTAAIIADIERVFLSRPGPYLRHSLAHGLFHDGTPYGADAIYGCALIIRLCLIPLFPNREKLQSLVGGS